MDITVFIKAWLAMRGRDTTEGMKLAINAESDKLEATLWEMHRAGDLLRELYEVPGTTPRKVHEFWSIAPKAIEAAPDDHDGELTLKSALADAKEKAEAMRSEERRKRHEKFQERLAEQRAQMEQKMEEAQGKGKSGVRLEVRKPGP